MGQELEIVEVEILEGRIVEDEELERGIIRDDMDWCEDCGHFHGESACVETPCGDYRCCIN